MLHCPTGAFVHIMDAFVGQTFTTDSPCPHPNYQSNKGDPVAFDPIQRVKCAPKSIVTVVQQLCQGMNTCDLVRKLSRTDSGIDCQYVATLRVNYTCFPAFAQQEVVCADSYVELSCKNLGSEATLLLLHAKLDSNPKAVVDSRWNGKTKHCTDSVELASCKPLDVSALVARNCNRRSVCTVNPTMIVEQLRGRSTEALGRRANKTLQGQHGSEGNEQQHLEVGFRAQSNCAKPNLYLEYTCAPAALLHSALRTSAAQEKKRLNKSLQFMRRQRTESPGIEQLQEFTLDSFVSSEQENDPGSDGSMPINPIVTSNSEALHDGPRTLLLTLLPSVICLLLVSILVAYIIYTKRRSKQNHWCQKQQHNTDQSCSKTLNCPDELMTVASTSTSAPTHSNRVLPTFVEHGRFLLNLKDRVPWSPNEIRRVSNSLNDPVCCECSEIDGELVCSAAEDVRLTFDRAVTRAVSDNQCQNSIQTVHTAKTTSHSLSNTVYEGQWGSNINQTCQVCSMKSSTIEANSTTPCNQGGKNEMNAENAYGASKQTELYTPFPANYFPVSEQNTIGPLFDSTQNWRQYGYPKPKQEPEHKSTTMTIAPPSPRTHSNRLGVVGSHELYQSITRSNSENQAQNPLKLTGQRPAKVAPPLFKSTDNFIRNIAEPYQSAHAFKLRFTKVPVVRYPYEVEDDSDDHSQSTNQDHQDGLIPDAGSLLRQNRPDLCPPIKVEDKLSTSSPEDDSSASKKITLLSSYDRMEYNDSNSISITSTVQPNSSPSVIDSCTSPDYTVVDEYKSRVNMSPRPYPRLLSNVSTLSRNVDVHPSPKLNKQLRFQTPILELPHTVYDQNNVLSTCDMSTSMCRRSNRQP